MTGLSFGIQKSDHNNELVVTDGRIPGGGGLQYKKAGMLVENFEIDP